MDTLKQRMEKWLQTHLFDQADEKLEEAFRRDFGPEGVVFVNVSDKPAEHPAKVYLVCNGTEVFMVVNGVKAELTGR